MKKILFCSLGLIGLIIACSKGSDSPAGNDNNSIQKQILNTKWYFDSVVFWHIGDGFEDIPDYNGYNSKTYILFGEDSIMTEYYWTGLTYEKTEYPYVWNGDVIACDYDAVGGFPSSQIVNNQLIFADLPTLPRKTDTTGKIELLWWYYHR